MWKKKRKYENRVNKLEKVNFYKVKFLLKSSCRSILINILSTLHFFCDIKMDARVNSFHEDELIKVSATKIKVNISAKHNIHCRNKRVSRR